MTKRTSAWLRYVMWIGIALTAFVKWREFPNLPSAWVYHLTGNSLTLFFPELYRALSRRFRFDERAAGRTGLLPVAHRVICDVVQENPEYADYVAPPAL